MHTKPCLTRDDALRIVAAARAEAETNGWPVTIAVADDGGHLIALERLDGCPAASAYIAPEKARAAALGRRETRIYEEMINAGRVSFLSVPVLQGMLEGGVPVMVDGQLAGSIGVSGVKAAQDGQIALAGIAALAIDAPSAS
jgi:glc operon protein GlcG